MINIFIGWDAKETIAYHVLSHSIITRSSVPVSITPVNRANLRREYQRPRGEKDSTDFSNSRFIVPHLMDYKGWAIFMDCDMLCLGDIAELWDQRDSSKAVIVKQHNYVPRETTKFLGQEQTVYERKNWSSLMLMNCGECQVLTKQAVNSQPGLWLHRFGWVDDSQIGAIKGSWNHLVGVDAEDPEAKLPHYTLGGPWHGYNDVEFAREWFAELEHMEQGDNPVRWRNAKATGLRSVSVA
jgi:hypothetical protein